jgi:hypothetical protein
MKDMRGIRGREAFMRADASISRTYCGVGSRLAISAKLATLCGYTLTIEITLSLDTFVQATFPMARAETESGHAVVAASMAI